MNKHLFALHYAVLSAELSPAMIGQYCSLTDKELVHRMQAVLRVRVGQSVILFDRNYSCLIEIVAITKKQVEFLVRNWNANQKVEPEITLYLPLLKRDALSSAIYSACELAATKIVLLTTEKIQHKWAGSKEKDRLERIIISAAEQSKNFAFPLLEGPISFDQAVERCASAAYNIFLDPAGLSAPETMALICKKSPDLVNLLLGPEADLTVDEKELLKKYQWQFMALTPTILRARQAVAVALGLLRSFI